MPAIPSPLVTPRGLDLARAWEELGAAGKVNGATTRDYTVLDGEYARIVSITFYGSSDATAGAHSSRISFLDTANNILLQVDSTGTQDPLKSMPYWYGVAAKPANTLNRFSQSPLPDILIPSRTIVRIQMQGGNADGYTIEPSLIVDHFPWTGEADNPLPLLGARSATLLT